MYTNESSEILLKLTILSLHSSHINPVFIVGTLTYLVIVFCNLLVLTVIVLTKKLHKPMYILLLNLPISDTVGATSFFPQFVYRIMTGNQLISYPACVIQAFFIHFYGTGNLLILSFMAYDRYVAICYPLRYNTIINPNTLTIMIILIWLTNFSVIFTLILLLVRLKLCRTNIVDFYCNNPSLIKLVCEDTTVNNLYGIAGIIFIQGGSLLIIIFTYSQILRTCLVNNKTDARRKAMQTCGTHLVVFLLLQINTVVTLAAHRLENTSPTMRRALGVSVLVFPPFLDPIIYGLRTGELRENIILFLKRYFASTKL